jgi:hypothetical protein
MAAEKKTPKEIFDAILLFEHDEEIEGLEKMTDEEVDEAIRAEGGDPVAIGERGAKLANELMERRERLQWQLEAREELAIAAAAAGGAARVTRSRKEMIEAITQAQNEEGLSIGLAARKGGTDEATDEELEELLRQIEILRGANGRPVD